MVLDALWDLVWAGLVTNDSPAALRAYLSGAASIRALGKRRSGPFRSRRQAPPSAVGRWSLVLPHSLADSAPQDAEEPVLARRKQGQAAPSRRDPDTNPPSVSSTERTIGSIFQV